MGLYRFLVEPPDKLDADRARAAYISGVERVPWQTHCELRGNELCVERAVGDSGKLNVLWPVDGRGRIALSTGTLIERDEPYQLSVELARGTLHTVREELSRWQVRSDAGPDGAVQALYAATRFLAQAVSAGSRPDVAAEFARQSIASALKVADGLVDWYGGPLLDGRLDSIGQIDAVLGVDMGRKVPRDEERGPWTSAVNTVVVPVVWRQVEPTKGIFDWEQTDRQIDWASGQNLIVVAGPLLELRADTLPTWLPQAVDSSGMTLCAVEFVRHVVERYRGRIHAWQIAANVPGEEGLSLAEDNRLRLAAKLIEVARATDPPHRVVIRFDEPWGEYMSRKRTQLSPLHFADTLARAGLGLTGICLDVKFGYTSYSTLPRHPLEIGRLADLWGLLGLPLWIRLVCPADVEEDADSLDDVEASRDALPPDWNEALQARWVEKLIRMLLAKPGIEGLVWGQLADNVPHRYPHSGLMNTTDGARQLMGSLAECRRQFLP